MHWFNVCRFYRLSTNFVNVCRWSFFHICRWFLTFVSKIFHVSTFVDVLTFVVSSHGVRRLIWYTFCTCISFMLLPTTVFSLNIDKIISWFDQYQYMHWSVIVYIQMQWNKLETTLLYTYNVLYYIFCSSSCRSFVESKHILYSADYFWYYMYTTEPKAYGHI